MSFDDQLDELRQHAVKLAYRFLGQVNDAEDVAQEALLRLSRQDQGELKSPVAWLTRCATRLCLDRLRSAEKRKVRYVGVELPEPWFVPGDENERDDTLSMALLTTIQRLRPVERAVFLLHDVFDHRFSEVAAMLDLAEANCRQIAARARKHLQVAEHRTSAAPEEVETLMSAFFTALEAGNTEELEAVLAEGVELRSDGGGHVPAAPKPVVGRTQVIAFFRGITSGRSAGVFSKRKSMWMNGAPGIVVRSASGKIETAFSFLVSGSRIHGIFAQRNPEKLGRLMHFMTD